MNTHTTKRLYFPDVVEPDSQYDKYPIVTLPPLGEVTMLFDPDTLIDQYNAWIGKKKKEYGF